MPERPESVPAAAEWSASDNEWVLAETDAEGRKHGLVTYWRPDGTLVNHCDFVHDVPHGSFKRYHESGEVSRQGSMVQGRIDGLDVAIRSDQPTTENFPPGLAAAVWRVENTWRGGRVVSGRLFDREGNPVSETGERLPDRPASVPEGAVYSSKGARWLFGESDEAGRKHGEWRYYHRDGWLEQLVRHEHGDARESTTFSCALESEGELALRAGDASTAAERAGERFAQAQGVGEQLEASWLWVRALVAQGDVAAARARAEAALALDVDGAAGSWGVFTPRGQRTFAALIELLLFLARQALEAGDAALAVERVERARGYDRGGRGDVQVVRTLALSAAGERDAALEAARRALETQPDAPELAELAGSAEFAAWLTSIDPGDMTPAGARALLGDRGERLAELCAPILDPLPEEEEAQPEGALDVAWPLDAVLGERLSPELQAFCALRRQARLDAPYRGAWLSAAESSLGEAVAAEDGTWVARVQSVFLPASVILCEEEELWLAEWHPSPEGNSRVLHQHQDEPEYSRAAESIVAAVVYQQFEGGGDLEERGKAAVSTARRRQLLAACQKELDAEVERPAHLDALALEERTKWIVTLLVEPVELGGLETAATWEDWERERELLAAWPHLAAYWLFHHAVFGNREELAFAAEQADARYPAARELQQLAAEVLAGEPVRAPFWDDAQVRGLRAEALDTERTTLFSPAALAAAQQENEARLGHKRQLAEAKAALAARGEETAPGLSDWDLLETCAGKLAAMENAMAEKWIEDRDESLATIMGLRSGRSSMLVRVYLSFVKRVDASWRSLFEAACAMGAGQHEEHEASIPGAFVGLGAATGDFAATLERANALHPQGLGRQRRIEFTALGVHLFEQPAAQAFLRAEAERTAAQFDDWSTDTAIAPLHALLIKQDPAGYAITNRMLAAASFSGANWRPALTFVERYSDRSELAPAFEACLRNGLGRHDDGDRAQVAVALAKSAGAAAVPVLEELLGSITDVRAQCERAALLAGLLTAEPASERWLDEARDCLQQLLDGRVGSMEFGAGVSLLRTLADLERLEPGDAQAAAFRERADEYAKAPLLAWLTGFLEGAPASP